MGNYGKNTTDQETSGTSSFNDLYDPDREQMQRNDAFEEYGPQGVTGWDYNFYDPYQTGYAVGPHWNYQNNPDGPPEDRLGNPPGGVGTGGAQPGEAPQPYYPGPQPNSGDPHDYTGMTLDQVNAKRQSLGEAPINQQGLDTWNAYVAQERKNNPTASFQQILGDWHQSQGYGVQQQYGGQQANQPTPIGTTNPQSAPAVSAQNKVGTVPGGPGDNTTNPTNSSGAGTNVLNNTGGGTHAGDQFNGDAPGNSDYTGTGPGHGQWINGAGSGGYSGPMVRPADRNSPALWSGPYKDWNQGGASGNRQLAGGTLYKNFNDLIQHPDLPDATKNAISTDANEASNARYASALGDLDRYGRATGNRSGYAAGRAQLAKDQGDTSANINRQNAIDFENMRFQRQQAGLQGMGGLYNTEGNFLLNSLAQRAALSSKPLSGNRTTTGTGNTIANGFGLNIG